jgi:hypothetical protein
VAVVSAACPNRRRHRRLAHGGGTLECSGRLEVVLSVPVILPLKSMRAPSVPEKALPARTLRSGIRIPAATLRAAFEDPTLRDIVCSKCGWSLRKATSILRGRRRA